MIISIVVSYHPDVENLASMLKILDQQVDFIVLVDNGSNFSQDTISSFLNGIKVKLIPLGNNFGLGVAINHGLREAQSLGASFVLLMDQDSIPKSGMVRSLSACYSSLQPTETVAAVGPRFIDNTNAHISSHVCFQYWHVGRTFCKKNGNHVLVDFLITSGSLIPLSVIADVGEMDETLFIDHVDTEWILRAKSKGYKIFGDCNAFLEHELGDYRKRIWLFRWRDVPVHKPFRYYYIFRNSILLYRRKNIPLTWKRIDLVRLFQIIGFTLLFGPKRIKKISMIFRGIFDGIRGKTGKIDD